jgi:hypothetical protein
VPDRRPHTVSTELSDDAESGRRRPISGNRRAERHGSTSHVSCYLAATESPRLPRSRLDACSTGAEGGPAGHTRRREEAP